MYPPGLPNQHFGLYSPSGEDFPGLYINFWCQRSEGHSMGSVPLRLLKVWVCRFSQKYLGLADCHAEERSRRLGTRATGWIYILYTKYKL